MIPRETPRVSNRFIPVHSLPMNRTINLQDHITELVKEGRALSYQLESHFNAKLVHNLRVCMRRLRTMINLIDDNSILPDPERTQMKSIWRQLSKVRDLDVGHELSDKYSFDVSKLKGKRTLTRKKLRSKLSDDKTQKLFDELEKLGLRSSISRVDPLPLLRKLRLKLIRTPGGAEHLHELRIVLKQIRYLEEALGFDVEAFKEYQDALGEFHDLEVFQEKHPHSMTIRRALNNKKLKALGMARSAVQLGIRTLGDVENQFEREMAIKAS